MELLTTKRPRAGQETLLSQAPGQGRKETDSWLFLASVPSGKSLKVTLEPPAEGGPNQHNPAPSLLGRAPSRARRETLAGSSRSQRATVADVQSPSSPASLRRCPLATFKPSK